SSFLLLSFSIILPYLIVDLKLCNRTVLSIPDSYRMSDIDRQIFNTAKKEFTLVQENGRPLFEYFRVEKVKAKKGNRISSFKIYFKEHRLNISMHNWLNEDE
ncbi:RepB family plasmid replication initiator protein, partial [Enterococcus faecium]